MLTINRLKQVLNYDPVTGEFIWVFPQSNRVTTGEVAGTLNKRTRYRIIGIDGHQYRAHRLAWFYMTERWPSHQIDHIDRNRENNAWSNLRDVPGHINQQNRGRSNRSNKTGVIGVTKSKQGQCFARIHANGVSHYLGTFATPEEAGDAYQSAKLKLHHASRA